MVQIGKRMNRMIKDSSIESGTITAKTEFGSNKMVHDHFESLFEPWMTWENHGEYEKTTAANTVWHIGHRIPKSVFDPNDENDVKRCWSLKNLYPQCAKENIDNGDRKTMSDRELIRLQSVWPVRARTLFEMRLLFKDVRPPDPNSSSDEQFEG